MSWYSGFLLIEILCAASVDGSVLETVRWVSISVWVRHCEMGQQMRVGEILIDGSMD